MRRFWSSLLLHLTLALAAALTLAPLFWMLAASLMRTGESNSLPPPLWPKEASFAHYVELFTRLKLARNFGNSLLIAVSATVISIVTNSMAGYAFAKLRFGGRERIWAFLLAGMVIPAQVGMLPLFLLLKSMGLVNTMVGAIVPGMASIFGIFMIRQYTLSIPNDLLDAARVDGAGELRLFTQIVVPVIRPILVTLGAFTFLTMWNDFMWPLIILSDDAKYTLPVALAILSGEHVQDTELMMAGSVLTILPVMIVFLALQRAYIRGIMAGSVKG